MTGAIHVGCRNIKEHRQSKEGKKKKTCHHPTPRGTFKTCHCMSQRFSLPSKWSKLALTFPAGSHDGIFYFFSAPYIYEVTEWVHSLAFLRVFFLRCELSDYLWKRTEFEKLLFQIAFSMPHVHLLQTWKRTCFSSLRLVYTISPYFVNKREPTFLKYRVRKICSASQILI